MPRHVAIIMDGNGRWATARGRARALGHAAGARAAKRSVERARRLGVPALTLYAFSSDNWRRPDSEVFGLMSLFRRYLAAEVDSCLEHGIRLSIIGRRDRLSPELVRAIAAAEDATAACSEMWLRIAIDYSSRDLLVQAAAAAGPRPTRDGFARALAAVCHAVEPVPDVDLLIRTGGEQRISDFLLWECAYAELVFTSRMWPDFMARDLDAAIAEYQRRERRFGAVHPTLRVAGSTPAP
jgi:undecaprenyl diphosphate synthase